MESSIDANNDAKQVFKKCGTCSRTFAHILNREFGHIKEPEEAALNPLAGGIMNEGRQCGMLWGAALAIGAEAYRRYKDTNVAIEAAVTATQNVISSFVKRSGTTNCSEIIGFNLKSFLGMTAFMLKVSLQGMNKSHCFNLAEAWAPEAIEAASKGLALGEDKPSEEYLNCTADVVKRMGGTKEEQIMVAGFAGGLGLTGNGCGALSAAIWKKMVDWCKENPGKNPPFFNNKDAKKILRAFNNETNGQLECHKICGRQFSNVKAHSDYIQNGGCRELIEILART
ncbi:MAG: C-GCAxxG-C-C family protein [Flavobacteriaceae bacterium]|nr:C-GCAxxG-C-C family protein [Flavobacteriaceae bacterium]